MRIGSRLRYEVTALLRTPGFLRDVKREAVRQLIGHTRIIGWEDGLPVRSLTIPAEFSPAFATSAARLYNAMRSRTESPGIASLSVTAHCDCTCPHCFAFDQPGESLSTAEWVRVVEQAMDLGVFTFVINGGEPLLRPDLPEIIRAIDPGRATCLLYTNGSRLAERAGELRAAGLRRVAIALDSADPRQHDRHRGRDGLFAALMEGYEAARRLGMLVGFSTFATPGRLQDGSLEGVFEHARRARANEIIVYDALPSGKWRDRGDLRAPPPDHRQRMRALANAWWQRADAPGLWWYGHISDPANFGCSGGLSMFSVAHNGELRPCDFCRSSVGRFPDESLQVLWSRLNRAARQRRSTHGPECRLMDAEEERPPPA